MMDRPNSTKYADRKAFLAIIAQGGFDEYRFPWVDLDYGFNRANYSNLARIIGLVCLTDHNGFDQHYVLFSITLLIIYEASAIPDWIPRARSISARSLI
jgi:hypothetical protein